MSCEYGQFIMFGRSGGNRPIMACRRSFDIGKSVSGLVGQASEDGKGFQGTDAIFGGFGEQVEGLIEFGHGGVGDGRAGASGDEGSENDLMG